MAHKGLRFYQARAAYWRAKMGAGLDVSGSVKAGQSCPRYLANLWHSKAHAARRAYEQWFRRTYEKWECIHRHEGAWNDPNPPYWGGLQMTRWFQQTYGPEFYRRWGTADRWPVWAQLVTAERAWRSDGDYGQWGTAPECGLPT